MSQPILTTRHVTQWFLKIWSILMITLYCLKKHKFMRKKKKNIQLNFFVWVNWCLWIRYFLLIIIFVIFLKIVSLNSFFSTYSQLGPSFITLFEQYSQSNLPPLKTKPLCGEALGRDSNPGQADLESGTLTTRPQHLIFLNSCWINELLLFVIKLLIVANGNKYFYFFYFLLLIFTLLKHK